MARKINKKKVNKVEVIEKKPVKQRVDKVDLGVSFHPRNEKQKLLVEAIETNDVVFAIGPAGTGKSFLAIATALKMLHENKIRKVILVRPMVEAGEKMGYLPGDSAAKTLPWMLPLLDAMDKLVGSKMRKWLIDNDVVQIMPLGMIRGTTFENACLIADETQNMTPIQFKTLLSRIGKGSTFVLDGDETQIDLPYYLVSGLRMTIDKLHGIDGITTIQFTEDEIVRHRLIKEILKRLVDDPIDEQKQ